MTSSKGRTMSNAKSLGWVGLAVAVGIPVMLGVDHLVQHGEFELPHASSSDETNLGQARYESDFYQSRTTPSFEGGMTVEWSN